MFLTRIFMLILMRTTIQLDDELFRRAKAAAAAAGITLSHLIEDSLRENLRRASSTEGARARRFRMVIFGQSERRVAHEPADFASAAEAEDLQSLGR
jgi:Arc/MetJ family transcription regulator